MTGFNGQTYLKKIAFWQQTLKMGLVHSRTKSVQLTIKYIAVSLMLWVYFSTRSPGHLVQIQV